MKTDEEVWEVWFYIYSCIKDIINLDAVQVELLNSREFKFGEYSQERSREYSRSQEFIENLERNIFSDISSFDGINYLYL